jgi:hypothetical protein
MATSCLGGCIIRSESLTEFTLIGAKGGGRRIGRHDPKKLATSGDKLVASAMLITREFH